MKVLVVIPTHDRTEFYSEAIASVMQQSHLSEEVITVEVMVTGNVGQGTITDAPLHERLNNAIAKSDCDAFVMLGDYDTLHPEFIARTVAAMRKKQVDIVYTDCMMFGDVNCRGHALGEWTRENIDRNTVPLVTSLCSKAAWKRAGGYEAVPFLDWNFWWKCFYKGATAYWLQEPLWNYRRHAKQDSNRLDWPECRRVVLARHEQLKVQWGIN
jgi:hypothetical protein